VLPARARIRRSEDFSLAVRRGRRVGSRTLVVHLLLPEPAPDLSSPTGTDTVPTPTSQTRPTPASARVGLVVSRAVGSAVVRNQVKRRLRALARQRLDRLPVGALLVVRANPAAAGASSAELGGQLDRALDRALAGGSDRPARRRPTQPVNVAGVSR
jgi:ribonuclease P protein component